MIIQLIFNGISCGAVYALVSVGFALVFSVLKFSNFSHGGVISACAFIAYLLNEKLDHPNLFITALITALCGMVLSYFVDLVCFSRLRLKGNGITSYYFLASVTMCILLEQLLTRIFSASTFSIREVFNGDTTVSIGSLILSKIDLVMLFSSSALLIVLVLIITKTRLGLAIRTVAIDSKVAQLMGINSAFTITATIMVSGFLAGVTGTLLGIKYTVFTSLGSGIMIKGFIASVIGGLGSMPGAIIAAVLLGIVEVVSTYIWGSDYTMIVLFIIMLIFLLVRPQGIMGKFSQDKA